MFLAFVCAAVALISYLIGSIPVAWLLVRWLKGIDVRSVGSGNVGATNAGRVLGKPGFAAVLIFDALKGFAPVILSLFISTRFILPKDIALLSATCAVAGHAFPVFLKFKGGKGVATGLGVFLALAAKPVLMSVIVFIIMVLIFRMVSLGSISAAISVTMLVAATENWMELWIFTALCAGFVIYKHRSNIKKISNGTENKVKLFNG
jgi:glycerol-3-phosphate acyltransferase PlsY